MSYGGGGVAKGGTTVDIGCTRLEYTAERGNRVTDHQFLSRSVAATARPLAALFDMGPPDVLNYMRKMPRHAFSLCKQFKWRTPLAGGEFPTQNRRRAIQLKLARRLHGMYFPALLRSNLHLIDVLS